MDCQWEELKLTEKVGDDDTALSPVIQFDHGTKDKATPTD
jgi:hypothetical protein